MTSLLRGALSYISSSGTDAGTCQAETNPEENVTSANLDDDLKLKENNQGGYLKRAVYGVSSGVYAVGSTTVGAGVSSVKWIAGTTYNVGTGVVGTAGSVVGAVGSGASAVVSKISSGKAKEHKD